MTFLGLNLRVSGYSSQGGRKYMEDAFTIAAQETEDGNNLEYAFFGIYDGHGGKEAAVFAKQHLMGNIVNLKYFWSDDDNLVLRAIRDGFLSTHLAMWKEIDSWPKTATGLPSTAGTTASVAFIRKGKLYIGHVGDSRIVLGFSDSDTPEVWHAESLTTDHKPDTPEEKQRIYDSGGLVMKKSGVDRVVWKRPRVGHQGPVRRSTDFDEVPFLSVARSLGDLWSYDFLHEEFVVSPEPDVTVIALNPDRNHCLIIASDGLWNVLSSLEAVLFIQDTEEENNEVATKFGISDPENPLLYNPSKVLVNRALERWSTLKMRADNTSVITILVDGHTRKHALHEEQDFLKLMLKSKSEECDIPLHPEEIDENVNICDRKSCMTSSRQKQSKYETYKVDSDESMCAASCSYKTEHDNTLPYRHSTSPLQSINVPCDVFKRRSSQPLDLFKERSIHHIPRWSKSASGQTSLSKLAYWSKLVNGRDLGESVSYRSEPYRSKSTSGDVIVLSTKLKQQLFKESTNRSYIQQFAGYSSSDGSCEDCCHTNLNKYHAQKLLCAETLKHFSSLKQTIKRKYPGADVLHYHSSVCCSNFKCDYPIPWKKKHAPNNLKFFGI